MKQLIRADKTYRIAEIPKLSDSPFIYQGYKCFTGSIFKRKLGDSSPFWHYGIYYGHDDNGLHYFLENNNLGVELVTERDFLSDASSFELVSLETSLVNFDLIMKRAYERANEIYDASHNNCEHFANYCVNGILMSFQAEMLHKLADALLKVYEINALGMEHSDLMIESSDEVRTLLGIDRRDKHLQELINNKTKK